MFFVGILFQVLVYSFIYALIGGLALKLAYRLFFRQYSIEYSDAFKLMFIAGLFAFGSNFVLSFAGIEGLVAILALPTIVNFVVVTIVLLQWEGLMLGQSLGVGAITTVFFLLLQIAIVMLIFGLLASAA